MPGRLTHKGMKVLSRLDNNKNFQLKNKLNKLERQAVSAQYLMGDNLKVVWVGFSTLS